MGQIFTRVELTALTQAGQWLILPVTHISKKSLRPDFNRLPLLPTASHIAPCHREIRKGAALTRGRPDRRALRSVSSSAAGPQNPAARDTGSRSPSEGLPDDSFEISRTVAVGTGSCQSLGEERLQQVWG